MNKLEKYKKEIGFRISILVLLCMVALLAVIIGNFYLKYKFPLKEDVTDYVVGFLLDLNLYLYSTCQCLVEHIEIEIYWRRCILKKQMRE